MHNTIIISHRGGAMLEKYENTLDAFTKSIELGVHMTEFDVRKTKDNQLIVFHDKKINKFLISNLTYKRICQITSKSGFIPPLFKDVLEMHNDKNIFLDIELKEHGYERNILNIINKYYPDGKFVIKSFDPRVVYKIKKLDPSITTGLLVGEKGSHFFKLLHQLFPHRIFYKCNADFLAIHYQFTLLFTYRFLKRLEAPIYVWTVNDIKQMKRLLKMKVDGIITDRPDLALSLIRESSI